MSSKDMRSYINILEEGFFKNLFKKKLKPPAKFPEPNWDDDTIVQWMRDKIVYFERKGSDPSKLFNPTTGDYFPNLLATGISWDDRIRSLYYQIRQAFPELVEKSKQEQERVGQTVSVSRYTLPDDMA